MKITNKILLSLPSALMGFVILILYFPKEFAWLSPSLKEYYFQLIVLELLYLIQVIPLIRKLWTLKQVKKSIKLEWTWIILFFSPISSLVFIWSKWEELNKINQKGE
ncbi:MAG: hypothetical protein LPK45_00205 [Bacteroidota bacterium]|nr:hypothetical protein [Bacteroidota bacterium]